MARSWSQSHLVPGQYLSRQCANANNRVHCEQLSETKLLFREVEPLLWQNAEPLYNCFFNQLASIVQQGYGSVCRGRVCRMTFPLYEEHLCQFPDGLWKQLVSSGSCGFPMQRANKYALPKDRPDRARCYEYWNNSWLNLAIFCYAEIVGSRSVLRCHRHSPS